MKKSTLTAAISAALTVSLVGTAFADTLISSPTVVFSAGSPTVEITDLDGTGALYLDTPNGSDKATVLVTDLDGTLNDISSLSYGTYREAGSGEQVASLNITVAPWAGTFVYEPVYDSAATVVDGQWQTWDALSTTARWWNTGDPNTFVTWNEIIADVEGTQAVRVAVNQGSGNAGLQSYVDFVEINDDRFDFGPVVHDPSAITAPTAGQEVQVGDALQLRAHDTSAANGGVNWAVREGTCAANTGTVAGNVDGFSNSFTWEEGMFAADVSTAGWVPGMHCFVFNPTQGERLTVSFEVVTAPVPPVTLADKDECKRGGWELSEAPEFKNQGECVSYFASNK